MRSLMIRPRWGSLSGEMEDIFENFFRFPLFKWGYDGEWVPRLDVKETKDQVSLIFELPGMQKKDVKVTVKDGILSISGKRELKTEEKDDGYIHSEICAGSFSRSFALPEYVDGESIKADYKDGMLEIKIDKKEEVKPKEIDIKVS